MSHLVTGLVIPWYFPVGSMLVGTTSFSPHVCFYITCMTSCDDSDDDPHVSKQAVFRKLLLRSHVFFVLSESYSLF